MKDKRKNYSPEEKKFLSYGASADLLSLLNPKGEEREGVTNFSFRCIACKN